MVSVAKTSWSDPLDCHRERIGIIGAGITGLACARKLSEFSFNTEVFDKSRSPGGRTSTRRHDSDLRFDHGAQFFTAEDSRFRIITDDWLSRGITAEWLGRIVVIEGSKTIVAPPQVRYVGVPGMSAMAVDLSRGLPVRTSTQIISVEHTSVGWTIATEIHENIGPFDALVVTLPAPQSAGLLATHPFAKIAAGVKMTPCWAVMVAFESRVEVPWDGAIVKGSPLEWVARNSSKPGRNEGSECWVLHASAEWTEAHLEDSAEPIVIKLLEAFEDVIGRPLPARRHMAAHRWRHSRGADPDNRGMLFDRENGLIVCGDWLSGGRIEDAYLAGIEAANAIRDTNLKTKSSTAGDCT